MWELFWCHINDGTQINIYYLALHAFSRVFYGVSRSMSVLRNRAFFCDEFTDYLQFFKNNIKNDVS